MYRNKGQYETRYYMNSARKVAILLAIGDREFTFGKLSMKAGCQLANTNYDFVRYNSPNAISKSTLLKTFAQRQRMPT
jgi:hypothetical protein